MLRPDVKYLILAITSRCNLRCRYCYMSAEESGQDMSDQILDKALDFADQGQSCHVQVTGGEPALLPDKLVHIGERCSRMSHRPTLAVQTNGTMLTKELVQAFKTHDFQIGVSLDGSPKVHDYQRGSADETLRGLKILEEYAVPFQVTTVVTRHNVADLGRLALLLAGLRNCQGLGLDLLVSKGRAETQSVQPASAAQLRQGISQLSEALTMINNSRRQPLRLREQSLLSRSGCSPHFCRAATGQSLAVRPDGRLYPCGQTMGDPVFSCGTVEEPKTLLSKPLSSSRLQHGACADCQLKDCCPDDCPGRLHYNTENKELACVLYQSLNERVV